ncbi:MAG: BON domain-containing protein [Promethearchaeati archaeon]
MSISEEKIKKDIVDQLYWDSRVDASEVEVEVDRSKVKLKGKVPNYSAKGAASADAWAINGVQEVDNFIDVEYPPSVSVPTDEEIKADIETSYELNLSLDAKDIDVSVTAGIVTLEGSVDAYWKKSRAESIASGVSGVLDIINKLTIVPSENFIDKEIAEDIIGSISRNFNVNAEKVDVKVEKGKVTLSGSVADWTAYRGVMDAAEFTAGVVDIDDNLIIESL